MKKNYIYLFCFCSMSILLSGCDFLDIIPTGKVIPTTAKEFRELITSGYVTFPDDRGLASFRSDEFDMNNSQQADLNSYKDIWLWNDAAPDDATAVFRWRQLYNVIFVANHVIESKDQIKEGSKEEIDQLIGEGYMLRAYSHFILVNLFAFSYNPATAETDKGVPLKLDNNMDDVLPRNSVAEVYRSILSDISKAKERLNVSVWEKGKNYRFNTLSADFLLSRVYLYMRDWDKSLEATRRVIQQKDTLVNMNVLKMIPNRYDSPESVVAIEKNLSEQYKGATRVDNRFLNRYTSGDLRKSIYFKAQTATYYSIEKGGSYEFKCSMRMGEIYLNGAEAAAQKQEIQQAKLYLERLLRYRYNTSGWNTQKAILDNITTQQELLPYIWEQRALELFSEGHRWFDLRRTDQPELTKVWNGTTYTLQKNDPRYTIPIPQEAKHNNPYLSN